MQAWPENETASVWLELGGRGGMEGSWRGPRGPSVLGKDFPFYSRSSGTSLKV